MDAWTLYELIAVCFILFCLWLARRARIATEQLRSENPSRDQPASNDQTY
jgi:hypothetical protein